MEKTLAFVSLVISTFFILAGCGSSSTTPVVGADGTAPEDKVAATTTVASGFECNYVDTTNSTNKTLVQIKGTKMHLVEANDDPLQLNMIIEDSKLQRWSAAQKEGYTADIALEGLELEGTKFTSGTDLIKFFQEKGDCKEMDVPDSMFVVPADVKMTEAEETVK